MMLKRLNLLFLCFCLAVPFARAEPLIHVLRKGETVFSVAKLYSVPFQAVLAANGIEDPKRVMPGTKLVIPSSHRVVKGETLYGIARAYGVALGDLLKANKLGSGTVIKPGDTLIIPGGKASDPPPASPVPSLTGGSPKPAAEDPSAADPVQPTMTVKPAPAAAWPAQGEAVYLDGKLFGIGIHTEENAAIRAVRSGTVISAGPFRGFGRVALIQSKDGLIYVYGGAQTLGVRIGESVQSGTEIGKVGIDLKEGRPIAYFLVFKEGKPLDPVAVPRD